MELETTRECPDMNKNTETLPEFIPLTISWNLTKRCNLACAHCYIDASAKEKGGGELSPQESIEILRQLAAVNREAVLILTGGEPLLRKDIFELIQQASTHGFWTVLGSHGGLLEEKTAEKLIESGLKGVGVSLDSLSPQVHNRFRGIDKAWEKTVSAISVMRSKQLPFLIETTMTPFNKNELPEMAAFALEKGASALNVFFLVPTGRGANLPDLTSSEYETTLKQLAELQALYAGRLLINAKCAPHYRRVVWELDHTSPFVRTFRGGGCPAGSYYCRITPEGDVTPCPYMPLTVGSLREKSFSEIWKDSPILHDFRKASLGGRCGACEFNLLCGGCRCRAYATTGNYLAEDPSCEYQPGKYKDQLIPFPAEQTYGIAPSSHLTWTEEALLKLNKIPFFARGMVKRGIESIAKSQGNQIIDEELMNKIRESMAGRFPLKPQL